MNVFQQSRKWLMSIALVLVLTLTAACGAATAKEPQAISPTQPSQGSYSQNYSQSYNQLARGNSAVGQSFGDWVVTTSQGLVKDAYVRDNNKLGVVISSQVRPAEVKDLARSLTQGFHKNFPNQDLTVLIYAPDKQLVLTTKYDEQSKQIQYQQAS